MSQKSILNSDIENSETTQSSNDFKEAVFQIQRVDNMKLIDESAKSFRCKLFFFYIKENERNQGSKLFAYSKMEKMRHGCQVCSICYLQCVVKES